MAHKENLTYLKTGESKVEISAFERFETEFKDIVFNTLSKEHIMCM